MSDDCQMEQLDHELDKLALKQLDLCQSLIHSKLKLERLTKDGYFLMAKSRYSNGMNSVSSSKLPFESQDEEFQANIKIESQDCLRSEDKVRFSHFSIANVDDQMKQVSSKNVKNRKNPTIEDLSLEDKKSDIKVQNHDPLKWFGILVPHSLRQSSECFRKAVELSVECANLQSELKGVEARQKFLKRTKVKVAKESSKNEP